MSCKSYRQISRSTKDPLMAIETLSLLAIYAQSADIHEAAYLYLSLVLRRFHYFL